MQNLCFYLGGGVTPQKSRVLGPWVVLSVCVGAGCPVCGGRRAAGLRAMVAGSPFGSGVVEKPLLLKSSRVTSR